MPSPRETRLQTDHAKISKLVGESGGTLNLVSTTGSPPISYVIDYRCPSLVRDTAGQVRVQHQHRVEITLGSNYPFDKPTARMLTPVFNPHVFDTLAFCLGRLWSATETLDALVLRIGAVLQLDPKVLDFNSLANHQAGAWVRNNQRQLPLPGAVTFRAPQPNLSRIKWS
jgi:hypothetical protein